MGNPAENASLYLMHSMQYAAMVRLKGQLQQAYEHQRENLRIARNPRESHDAFAGFILAEMGDVLCEQHRFEEGMKHFREGFALIEGTIMSDLLCWCYNLLCKAYMYQKDYKNTSKAVEEFASLFQKFQIAPWFQIMKSAWDGALFLAIGSIEEAQ